jgi:hypothetical protein
MYTVEKYTYTRYATNVKLAQHVYVYTYVDLVAVFAAVRMRRTGSPAASKCCSSGRETGCSLATCAKCHVAAYIFSSGCEGLKRLFSRLFVGFFIGARQVRIEPEGHSCRTISYSSIMKSYCLRDISPSRTHNRRDRSPGCQLCYVTEQYVPRIGYLKERVRT